MTAVLVGMVRATGGQSAVDALLEQSGCPHEASYLETVGNWIAADQAVALLETGVRITGDPTFAERVGQGAVRQHAGSPVATVLRSLGSPEKVLAQVTLTVAKFSTVTEMEATEIGPGRAVVRSRARPGHRRDRRLCEWARGLLSTPPELFGLGSGRVHETECQARGGRQCIYEVTWDAAQAEQARDPERRVTALEAQLGAMSERLQSAYATAGDIVSPDDVHTVLERIVERAAREVRAPEYMLAIRPGPLGDLQVFARGIGGAEARALAELALDPEQALPESLICVEVSSSRRDYGRLIARQPPGTEFFPQERLALSLYAKYAAAVLDMTVALHESAGRHEQVSALLSLAHALAHAGTTEETSRRLAEALPSVIDCDRAAVWLWEERQKILRSAHTWGFPAAEAERHRQTRIDAQTTPLLERVRTSREPLFLTADSRDDFIRSLLRDLGAVAVVLAPIVHREEFLGALTVSVVDRPDRLRQAPELLERLTGIAALASPAIQNGRLVDELAFKASHDALTGVLNRIGFGQLFDGAVAEAGTEGVVGLLFADLDGFKEINDAHGHDAGDELLRQVAGRLSELVRGSDTVARLGGDEFAVILGDVTSVNEVETIARRLRAAFAEPFHLTPSSPPIFVGASVGVAVWPDEGHTADALVRYADAAMYRDKTRGRRTAETAGAEDDTQPETRDSTP
ncbi:MAG TPA: diguanylate cyclase [Solirubrobacteraceae bacterium]|nr:diguanylate cyclase [Solirubrobacteraceae bacterium]